MTGRKQTKLWMKLALLGATLLICLLVLEITLRHLAPVSLSHIAGRTVRLTENRLLMYELVPSVGDHNDMGFRDRSFLRTKKPGTYRIIALGDSLTYGLGVRAHETYPEQLEQQLNGIARLVPRISRFEVLNLGVPGYSILQEFELLRTRGLDLEPDLVVLLVCLNDWQPYTVEFSDLLRTSGPDRRDLFIAYYDPAASWLRRMLFRTQVYRHLKLRLIQLRSPEERKDRESATIKRHYVKHNFFERYFTKLNVLLAKHRIPLVVALIPYSTEHPQGKDRQLYAKRRRTLTDLCSRLGCELVDPLHGRSAVKLERYYIKDNIHLNAMGHRSLAHILSWPVMRRVKGSALPSD